MATHFRGQEPGLGGSSALHPGPRHRSEAHRPTAGTLSVEGAAGRAAIPIADQAAAMELPMPLALAPPFPGTQTGPPLRRRGDRGSQRPCLLWEGTELLIQQLPPVPMQRGLSPAGAGPCTPTPLPGAREARVLQQLSRWNPSSCRPTPSPVEAAGGQEAQGIPGHRPGAPGAQLLPRCGGEQGQRP